MLTLAPAASAGVWVDGGYTSLVETARKLFGWRQDVVRRPEAAKGFQVLPHRWVVEIVQSQMTKAGVLTAGAGRNDITNLDFVVGDNHSINEQFNQLPFLRKGRVGQARLDALAERFDRGGQTRQFGLAIDMAVELLLLGFQRLGFLLQLPASPLIFG